MSDLAALSSSPAASPAGPQALAAPAIQSASIGGNGMNTAQSGDDRPDFQAFLDRQTPAPAVTTAPVTPPVSPQMPAIQPAEQAAMAMMLANAVPDPLPAPGTALPAAGKILPGPAKPDGTATPDADTDIDPRADPAASSATTLALAGALASLAQFAAPVPSTAAKTPANAPTPMTARQPAPAILAAGNATNDGPQIDIGTGTTPETAAKAALAVPPATLPDTMTAAAASTPFAALVVAAEARTPALAAAVTSRMTLTTPEQDAASVTGRTPNQATRLRPVSSPESSPVLAFAPTSDTAGTQATGGRPESSLTTAPGAQDPAAAAPMSSNLASPLPPPLPLGGAGHPAAIPEAQPGGSTDFAALVDRLVEARAAARTNAAPQVVQASISHAQFGQVRLRFQQGDDGLSVSMTSADPDFGRTAQAALAAQPTLAAASASNGASNGSSGQQGSGQSGNTPTGTNAQSGMIPSNFGQSGQNPQGQQSHGQNPQREPGFAAASLPRQATTTSTETGTSERRQSGILA